MALLDRMVRVGGKPRPPASEQWFSDYMVVVARRIVHLLEDWQEIISTVMQSKKVLLHVGADTK